MLGAGNWELELELVVTGECCTGALLGSWMVTVVGLLFWPAMVLDLSHWARPREV